MMDNMALVNTIQGGTNIVIQEDPGNNAYNAKTRLYEVATDTLSVVLQSDPARFGDEATPPSAPLHPGRGELGGDRRAGRPRAGLVHR